jgi:subtilase family serine protease
MRTSIRTACVALAVACSLGSPSSAQGLKTPGVTTTQNTPGFIKNARDLGPVDPSTVISVTAWLKLHNEQQLDQLVKQQYTKSHPSFHKWVTQGQFNAQFAPTANELKAVQNWLNAHKLTTVEVAENNFYVKVQGSVADVEKAFHVQIDSFSLNGQTFRSNTNDPSINDSSGNHVAAITGLDDYGFQPNHVPAREPDGTPFPMVPLASLAPNGFFFEGQCLFAVQTQTFTGTVVSATYTGNRYGSDISSGFGHFPPCGYQPSEMQTAYNMNALYAAGLNGSGETIVIVDAYGSPTIAEDAALFSAIYGLPTIDLTIVKAPGLVNNPHGAGWDTETTLDVEWAHAMAPGAKIALVVSTNRSSLDEAINYAVVHHLGNTISNSWSTIEGFGNPKQLDRVNRILQMAAAQGIDVNFSSGDAGDETPRAGFNSVDFPASSPFATGIGGTSLFLNPDNTMAFQTGWGNNLTRIADILPGSTPVDPPLHLGFQGGAGGGSSLTFAKPDFQSALPGSVRLVPDISMLADPFTGAEFIQTIGGQPSVGVVGGTSLACPMFSGVMAIAAQKKRSPLGQAAPLVYTLPAGAVYDVLAVSSPDNVTGSITDSGGTTLYSANNLAAPLENTTSFFSALYNSPFSTRWFVLTFGTDTSLTTGPGWDNVTGVGTPNGVNFVNAIAP